MAVWRPPSLDRAYRTRVTSARRKSLRKMTAAPGGRLLARARATETLAAPMSFGAEDPPATTPHDSMPYPGAIAKQFRHKTIANDDKTRRRRFNLPTRGVYRRVFRQGQEMGMSKSLSMGPVRWARPSSWARPRSKARMKKGAETRRARPRNGSGEREHRYLMKRLS